MAILSTDIKLLKSERMTDNADGGGNITGQEVVDGASNNLFPDISTLDRVMGKLALRKVFASVLNNDTEALLGAHAIIDVKPVDPKVTALMFTTGGWHDSRDEAVSYVQSFRDKGAISSYVLWGNHAQGQSTIAFYSYSTTEVPKEGDVLYVEQGVNAFYGTLLSVVKLESYSAGSSWGAFGGGGFAARPNLYVCNLNTAFPFSAQGSSSKESNNSLCIIRQTNQVNASKFYGAAPTTVEVVNGTSVITVANTREVLIPRTESGAPQAKALDIANTLFVKSGVAASNLRSAIGFNDQTVSESMTVDGSKTSSAKTWIVPQRPIAPGSFTLLAKSTGGLVYWTITDDGLGNLSGVKTNASVMLTCSGTIDYQTGSVSLSITNPSGIASISITLHVECARAAMDTSLMLSSAIAITDNNRATYYSTDLTPIPADRTLKVKYVAGGTVYLIEENGKGQLTGTGGSGTYNNATGHVDLYLSSQPDSGSKIVFGWSNAARYTDRHADIGNAYHDLALTNTPVTASSVVITWTDGTAKTATDDGVGNITGDVTGTINYTTGRIVLNVSRIGFNYSIAFNSAGPKYQAFYNPSVSIDLAPTTADPVAVNSVMFGLSAGGVTRVFHDRDGVMYWGNAPVGTIDYMAGIASITDLSMLFVQTTFTIDKYGVLTYTGATGITALVANIGIVNEDSVVVSANKVSDNSLITAASNSSGVLIGGGITGSYDAVFGILDVAFPAAVKSETIALQVITPVYGFLQDQLGFDTSKLPSDGMVSIFRKNELAIIHHTTTDTLTNPVAAGATYNLSRGNLASVVLKDQLGALVPTAQYTVNLVAGTVTMANPLTLTGLTQPLIAEHRIEDILYLSDVQTNGKLSAISPVTHTFPVGSIVSSALVIGDLQARISNLFDQQTWTQVWSDGVIGNTAEATFNYAAHPIAVTNKGAITERWALVFIGATAFKIIGESVGEIAIGDTTNTCAPVNPNTGVPYFTINPLAWGLGWSTGAVLRFNTVGSNFPLWIARTVRQGSASGQSDSLRIQVRGDINA